MWIGKWSTCITPSNSYLAVKKGAIHSEVTNALLTVCAHRWPIAGRFKDLLVTLLRVGELPPVVASPSTKRSYCDDSRGEDPGSNGFPPTSGLAAAPRRTSATFAGSPTYPSSARSSSTFSDNFSNISTFGPPLGPQDIGSSAYSGLSTSNDNQPTPHGGMYPGNASQPRPPTASPTSTASSIPATPIRNSLVAPLGYGAAELSNRSASLPISSGSMQAPPRQTLDEFSAWFGAPGPGQQAYIPYDTPTPPSNEASPAAALGLGTDLYGQYSGGPVPGSEIPGRAAPPTEALHPDMQPMDELMSLFAPMIARDGQMGVGTDTVRMWSTMPATYRSVF